LWLALNIELKKLRGDGLQKKYDSCFELQKLVHEWVSDNNLQLFSKSPSVSLTAILLPKSIKATDVQKSLHLKGYYVATGQADFKERLIRIGHMANIDLPEMVTFLETLKGCLKELGH
jgi:aspartate aminotransferase-like enzyme